MFILILFSGCATVMPDISNTTNLPKTWKAVEIDCVTPVTWNVPIIYPDKLDMPDYFNPLLGPYVCIGYQGENQDMYYVLLKLSEDMVGLCQGEVMAFESNIGQENNKQFWKQVDGIPVEITFEEYEEYLYEIFNKFIKKDQETTQS